MFGYNSLFSGQTLYEKYIYQMYNITMTSLPIMWFALYDFEFEKDRPAVSKDSNKNDSKLLLRNPLLYKIGMNN
jgi:phospholipid-transporting ATPase